MRSNLLTLLGLIWLGACAGEPAPEASAAPDPSEEQPEPAPRVLPPVVEGVALYPETEVRLVANDHREAERLADVDACAPCHPDVVAAWRASPHAAASFDNPWYRQAVDSFREARGAEASRFCAGCHDPVLLVDDAMHAPIEPADPRAHASVTCMVCHGVQEVRADGVASYTLRTGEVPLPDPADEREVAAHVAALTPPPLRTPALCGSCHRGFLGPDMGNPHHLPGTDDLAGWRRSGYAGSRASRVDAPVDQATCQGCHMPSVAGSDRDYATTEGEIHSHRVPGGHTALAAARGDGRQLGFVQERLRDVARIDVMRASPDEARPRPGTVELDVVVRNLRVGHRFPGGIRDAQDTWIELEVRDADGELLAEAGTRHATSEDDTAHRLVASVVDDEGVIRSLHRVQHFRAVLFDRTLGPRDAAVVRYGFTLTGRAALPLSVDARLRHRRHSHAMHAAACAADRSARGRAFASATRELGRLPIDACASQPITEVASARVWLGATERPNLGGALAPPFDRHFDHALALIGDVQERIDAARGPLRRALRAAADPTSRAMVFAQRARLEGRQGRLAEALADVGRAERILGDHPALDRVRGDAYAQVWRWSEAAEAYGDAARGAPLDDSGWADLARALGSAGRDGEALRAASRGLALSPRHPGLLRTRFLSLESSSDPGAAAARANFLAHRVPDEAFNLTLRCAERSETCARERLPVHSHPLRTP